MQKVSISDKMIEEYVSRGWVIIPICGIDHVSKSGSKTIPGKTPCLKAWSSNQGKWKFSTVEQCHKWFDDGKFNIGLQCGMFSKVTVLDMDNFLYKDYLFKGLKINTLQDRRTYDRAHYYFKYEPTLPNKNLQSVMKLGVEIKNDGGQVVIPPSIHPSGSEYKWVNPRAPVQRMPKELKVRIETLIDNHEHLKKIMKRCRSWLFKAYKEQLDFHDEELMLAAAAELKVNGAELRDIQMFCKVMLGKNYDEKYTTAKWSNIDENKVGTASKLKTILPEHLHGDLVLHVGVKKNHKSVNPLIQVHATANEDDFYIVNNKGNSIEFRCKRELDGKNKIHSVYKKIDVVHKNGEVLFIDKNYGGESGNVKYVYEHNSPFVALYIKIAQRKGVRMTGWKSAGKFCKTALFVRSISNLKDNKSDWITEFYWKCKIMRNGKWVLLSRDGKDEYIPMGIQEMSKKEKYAEIRRLRKLNVSIKALSMWFNLSERRIQQIVPKGFLSCEL